MVGTKLTVTLSKLPDNFDLDHLKAQVAGKFKGSVVGASSRKAAKRVNASLATIEVSTSLARSKIKTIAAQLRNANGAFGCSTAHVHISLPVANSTAPNGGRTRMSTDKLWEFSKSLTDDFHFLIAYNPDLVERCADREEMGVVFQDFLAQRDLEYESRSVTELKRIEGLVMANLRRRKLLRSSRHGGKVIMIIAGKSGAGDFPVKEEQELTREKVMKKKQDDEIDKCGVQISRPCTDDLLAKPGDTTELMFSILSTNTRTKLNEILIQGPAHRSFNVTRTVLPMQLPVQHQIKVSFKARGIGVYRAAIKFMFSNQTESFSISRFVVIKTGDAEADRILQPISPYVRKQRKKEEKPDEVVAPPESNVSGFNPCSTLPFHRIPREIRSLIMSRELQTILEKPNGGLGSYEAFWRSLIWAQEFQAYEDVKSFDLEEATLKKEGHLFSLEVPGLSEGRPSVLKSDIVNVTWKKKQYQARVERTRLLDAILQFGGSFHRTFNPALDRVNVRFTVPRTAFRLWHEGAIHAEEELGTQMLAPTPEHVTAIRQLNLSRDTPAAFKWANRDLNEEQKLAITNIVRGEYRPLPYIIFGPPGTGKTTTVAEAVYQLAKHKSKPNILIVAPSNDAADNLVEKLSPFFPPSEMRRILAYSRSLEQVSRAARPYATEGLTDSDFLAEIRSSQLVISTINLAARFAMHGLPRGHFEVLVVDEAGHSTEPEVITVAATLMNFTKPHNTMGQLILAGDPRQLGPVVTSNVCLEYGLGVSYMERLTNTEVYGRNADRSFPDHLLTKLVRNYRSHPDILKLPNEMFYDGDLVACGQILATHDMVRWEHLPEQKFPVVFHAVHGENLREGSSPSWFNPQEAQEVFNYVDLLTRHTRPPVAQEDIGIITPYNRQAQKIRLLLASRNINNIKVGSVETFQGQERRCIIVSTVRAQSEYIASDLKYNLGFVANEKRFNVATTRAKSLLVVIGHPNVLALDKKNWLPFLRYCKERGGWLGEVWEEEDVVEGDDEFNVHGIDGDVDGGWDLVDGPSAKVEQEGMAYINSEL